MNRTVLVTGGARRIGAAIARHLAGKGHRVVVHYRASKDEAEALAREIDGVAVAADLADRAAVAGLIGEAAARAGAVIDGLVNCASLFEFDSPPLDDWALFERLAPVNLGAPVLLASALARQAGMRDGAVVNVLDQKVANLNPDFFSYSCTKIALAGATEMLARALAPAVRVNAVAPGLTLPSGDQSREEFETVARENLLRRPVVIDEIGRAVEFLLTTGSVTGQTVFVDCGQRFIARDGDVMFETRNRGMIDFDAWGGAGRYVTILDGLEVAMRLGIHAREVAQPQRVRLTVTLYVDYGDAPPGDDIAAAVDYDFVRLGVQALAERHFHLQETLCEAVAALCFADARVRGARVRSTKPDIYPDAAIGCEIVRSNPAR